MRRVGNKEGRALRKGWKYGWLGGEDRRGSESEATDRHRSK